MRTSKFNKFKKNLPRYIADFSTEADKDVDDNEWEMPIHRHCAAEILVWILNRTRSTLRKGQLIEAWRSIVRQCWNLMDADDFSGKNVTAVVDAIIYYKRKALYKKNDEVSRLETTRHHPSPLELSHTNHLTRRRYSQSRTV